MRSIVFASFVLTLLVLPASKASAQGYGWHDAPLEELKRASDRGDRNAELELGKRYEDGRGVSVDLSKAIKLYRAAAASAIEMTAYSSFGAKPGYPGSVTSTIDNKRTHLPEAEFRLRGALEKRRKGDVQ